MCDFHSQSFKPLFGVGETQLYICVKFNAVTICKIEVAPREAMLGLHAKRGQKRETSQVYSGTKISVPYFLHSKEVKSSNGHLYFLFYGKYRVMFSNNFLSLSQLIFWKWVYKISSFSRFVCFKKFVTLNILVTYDLHLVCFCLRKPLIQIFWFKIIIPCNLDLRKLKFYLQRRYLQLFYHKFIG